MNNNVEIINGGDFDVNQSYYPKVLNTQLDAMVNHFFNLNHSQIISRYTHLKPEVNQKKLKEILDYQAEHFFWGGADLFYVTTEKGNRRMVVLETNSCPSGQKSMPARDDSDDFRGYRYLIEESFLPQVKKRRLPKGGLAVIYDKNYMENSAYASVLAELTGESVYLIPHFDGEDQHIYFQDGVLMVRKNDEADMPIRAALRYVTQKPWNRIPVDTKTFIYNSMRVCLSGGRNKSMASKAYEIFNSTLQGSGLKINIPETIKDVGKLEVPLWLQKFGGKAVVKNPYSNAGQGVYTITNNDELQKFMEEDHPYDQFIVQSLIGHYNWSSIGSEGKFYHIGTIPNRKGQLFITDLRFMVYSTPSGFKPCILCARRAKDPLTKNIPEESWSILGTNLSVKLGKNEWSSDTQRLMIMDRKDFNKLGIGLDDLIEAYIQTVMSVMAIDKMACYLTNKKGKFRMKLLSTMDSDQSLLNEIMR